MTAAGSDGQQPSDWAKLVAILESAYTDRGVAIWLQAHNTLLDGDVPLWLIEGGRSAEVIAVAERMTGVTWQEALS